MGKQKTKNQPHSLPGNQKVGLNIAPAAKQDLHFCSSCPCCMTKLKDTMIIYT